MSSTPKLVLVTGANGYLGSAVVQHCLEHGYHVRGTVRSQAKAEGVKGLLQQKYGSALSFVAIDDMTKEGVYEQAGALDGVDAVCHVASPVPDIANVRPPTTDTDVDWVRDMVEPAIQGTLTLLRAASKFPRISHVTVISSMAAVMGVEIMSDPVAMNAPHTPDDWNRARKGDEANKLNAFAAYFASKTEAELAAWRYVKEAQPHYILATFCPPYIFGPAGFKAKKPEDIGSSLGLFHGIMKGIPPALPMDGSYVDARDIAEAFRLTIEKPLKEHQRFLLVEGSLTSEEVMGFVKTLDPSGLQHRPTTLDTSNARQLLGWTPRSKKETFVDMAAYLQEQEKGFSK